LEPTSTERPTRRPTARATPRVLSTPRATASPTPAPAALFGQAPTGATQLATVASITDGDTIRVLIDGVNYPVRYIGIDTPEIHDGVEWMGQEASDANAGLVAGREVVLEKDVSETDQYGRMLRYVWLQDGSAWLLVNLELLRLGVAQVTTYPPDVKYVDRIYLPAQQAAVAAGIGLWGAPPTPTPAPAVIQPFVPPAANCEASYPDVCIPLGSADLDCGDIAARRFTVRWDVPNPDPHRFDGDGDGLGCES
jgi:micrococcal nuclease